jgi:hypothetical protein
LEEAFKSPVPDRDDVTISIFFSQDRFVLILQEESDEEEEGEECPFCFKIIKPEAMAQHVSELHRLGCLRCRRLLATEDELEEHLQRHEEQFVCSLCPEEQFEDEADYEFHRMSMHDALKCPKCTQVLLAHEFPGHTRACQRKQVPPNNFIHGFYYQL